MEIGTAYLLFLLPLKLCSRHYKSQTHSAFFLEDRLLGENELGMREGAASRGLFFSPVRPCLSSIRPLQSVAVCGQLTPLASLPRPTV
jgi:hypothetical protein